MKSKLMHNLGLKIMAVLISVVLWMCRSDRWQTEAKER